MAITTMDGLISAIAAGQKLDFFKASQTAEGAGTWHSFWKAAGNPPAGVTPAGGLAGEIPTKATLGALPFNNPGAGLSYIAQALASITTVGKLILYDRLWHNSGMSGTQVTVDTTLGATASPNRYASFVGNELWVEFYTAIGGTGATLNVKYKDEASADSSYATYVHPANAESVGQMAPMTLLSPDTGITKATNYHWSVSTGTAGDFGLVILRRILEIPLPLINAGMILDALALGMPTVENNACLALMVQCSTSNTGIIQGSFKMAQG